MKKGICCFCEKESELVESHIIPKGLYCELIDSQNRPAKMLSPFKKEYPKKRPKGFYDWFLCHEHEKQFNDWDTYACRLLRDSTPEKINDDWVFNNVDYPSIKLFFVSMLWRAHYADNEFFDRVKLGPHADVIKKMICRKDPSVPDNYSISLWRSEELTAKVVMAPFCHKYDGITFYNFYLPGYKALIKVDKQQSPSFFHVNSLNDSGRWLVKNWNYIGSSEEKMMYEVARKNMR